MLRDEQGFLYIHVDSEKCINCDLCVRVCPVINPFPARVPHDVYAAKIKDTAISKKSSSGGAFYALASQVLNEGGVVFGAKYNSDWTVEHGYTESIEGLELFMGSKYMQSVIGDSYSQAQRFLKANRKVLFSGTPCQIAGLKRFLRKEYGGLLLTVDVVCHGVPSPKIWEEYLAQILKSYDIKKSNLESLSFRDKSTGWNDFSILLRSKRPFSKAGDGNEYILLKEVHRRNAYMTAFLRNYNLRPSCFNCPFKCGKSSSDITLGDFWGVRRFYRDFYSPDGVSVLLRYNDKIPISSNQLSLIESDYQKALCANYCIEKSIKKPSGYSDFWNSYEEQGLSALWELRKKVRPNIFVRGYYKLRNLIKGG